MSLEEPQRVFKIAPRKLDAFYVAYEGERKRRGLGAALYRISPQQRIDVLTVIDALNKAGGWKRVEQEGRRDLWLRYLRPLLAETRESVQALKAALTELPGFFEPELEDEPAALSPPPPIAPAKHLPRGARGTRWVPWIAGLALLAGLGYLIWPDQKVTPLPETESPESSEPVAAGPRPSPDESDLTEGYNFAAQVVQAALEQEQKSLTPRELASYFAGGMPELREPAAILNAMLRRWPLPADQPIAKSPTGALALKHYALAAAGLASGKPVDSATQPWMAATLYPSVAEAFDRFAQDNAPPEPAERHEPERWPDWVPYLAFAPLLLPLGWMLAGLPRAVRMSLRRARPRERGYLLGVAAPAIKPPLPRLREQIRHLMRREPEPGRTLDASRSIEATIANGGFLTPVMRPVTRAVEYVVLVQRYHHGDHELVRMRRIIETLKAGGLPITAYEFDFDLNEIYPASAMADEAERQPLRLDLRTLQEIHPNARLVLATEGRELVDFFTRRPLPVVAEALRRWPQTAMLTPVPMEDWSEREMNLAQDLDLPLARATAEGLFDLARGFDNGKARAAAPTAASTDVGGSALAMRIVSWLNRLRATHAPDTTRGRPEVLCFNDPALTSETVPTEAFQAACVRGLRRWLGPHGFFWLGGCALYPDLRSDITFYLGMTLRQYAHPANDPVFDEGLFSRLSLLPWFRLGHMPNWLREAVFRSLDDDEKEMAQARMKDLLEERVPSSLLAAEQKALPVWWPEGQGLDAPRDAIMVDLEPEGRSSPLSFGSSRALWQGIREVFLTRGLWLLVGALFCAAAWYLWPKPADTPHALGAWLPLITFIGIAVAVTALVFVWFRSPSEGRTAPPVEAFAKAN